MVLPPFIVNSFPILEPIVLIALMNKRFSLIFTLFFSFQFVLAQGVNYQKRVDSLLLLLQKHNYDDTVKLKCYETVYKAYIQLAQAEKAEDYVGKTIQLSKMLKLGLY